MWLIHKNKVCQSIKNFSCLFYSVKYPPYHTENYVTNKRGLLFWSNAIRTVLKPTVELCNSS